MKDFKEIKKWLADADAVIVTAGNGFAQMEGLDMFDNLAFPIEYKNISEKYHVKTIADALDKDFDSWDDDWVGSTGIGLGQLGGLGWVNWDWVGYTGRIGLDILG